MITRYLANVNIAFNPFTRGGRTARIFASLLPPDARQSGMKVITTVLPREAKTSAGKVEVVFST
jgi:large subunit ribosomal protein L53